MRITCGWETRDLLAGGLRVLTGVALLALATTTSPACVDDLRGRTSRITISAGTVYNLKTPDDPEAQHLYDHQVRGIVQMTHLGNARVFFDVDVFGGDACAGNHVFCLTGEMVITTLANEELRAVVVGWADPDPADPKENPTMFLVHYTVTFCGGTGSLSGARGRGIIDGAFTFCDALPSDDSDPTDDCFCEGYSGVATWVYDGVLTLPRPRR